MPTALGLVSTTAWSSSGTPSARSAAVCPRSSREDFVNRRSEWYRNLRKRFEDGEIDIDPLDKALAQQLVKIKWSMTSKGQIAVETKKEIRACGLPSPDRADAVAYAFAHVDLPTVDVEAHQGESIIGDLMQKAW